MASGRPGVNARITILGTGRMGRQVWELARVRGDVEVVALVGRQALDWVSGTGLWQPGLEAVTDESDLLIDFSLPEGTLMAAEWCAQRGVALLSGVTGLGDDVLEALRTCSTRVPVLWSPNLSVGVNLLAELVARVASVTGPEAPVLIDDRHHQWKKDAPSGTALMLGRAVSAVRGGDDQAVTFRSRREGEVVGEHRVCFQLADEEITLEHKAGDRRVFARGALEAGLWLRGQEAGFYSAADWLAAR